MARSTSTSSTLNQRERDRILSHLDKLQRAHECGHRLLLNHARCLIEQRRTGRPAEGHLDSEEFATIAAEVVEAARDLETEARLVRPFHVRSEWARFDEYGIIADGQRSAFRSDSDFAQGDEQTDEQKWEDKVIKPMTGHHIAVIAAMDSLRRDLRATTPRGEPGRPRKYPAKLIMYVRKLKGQTPPLGWKEVYRKCKEKFPDINFPKRESFIQHMQRVFREGD
jgi:hypothetical protein